MSDNKKIDEKNVKEEDLSNVSGGGWWSSDKSYASGDEPEFKVGDRVMVVTKDWLGYGTSKYGYVTKILSKSANVRSEFRYEVKYDDGTTESDIFESQMMWKRFFNN